MELETDWPVSFQFILSVVAISFLGFVDAPSFLTPTRRKSVQGRAPEELRPTLATPEGPFFAPEDPSLFLGDEVNRAEVRGAKSAACPSR